MDRDGGLPGGFKHFLLRFIGILITGLLIGYLLGYVLLPKSELHQDIQMPASEIFRKMFIPRH